MWNPASVPWHWIKAWRPSFGWSRKEQLYCFARQRGPQRANALKIVCPDLEGLVRSFIAMVQSGRHQLVDILLIGWWWGKGGSASSTFGFQPVWCLRAGGQHTVNFSPPDGGFSVCKTAQRYCYVYPLRGNQDPVPRLHYCFLTVPPLSHHPLPSLISNCLNLPVGTQGRSWRLHEAYFL